MVNYQNSFIYKIQHKENKELIYIGSSTNYTRRKQCHKDRTKNKTTKLYETIRNNGGFDNFIMEEIKKFPCNSKKELEIEEQKCMEEYNCTLNTLKSFITEEDKKIRDAKSHKKLYEINKEERKKYVNEWINNNREKHNEYNRKTKAKYKEYNKEKVTCECGAVIARWGLYQHKKTKQHKLFFDV